MKFKRIVALTVLVTMALAAPVQVHGQASSAVSPGNVELLELAMEGEIEKCTFTWENDFGENAKGILDSIDEFVYVDALDKLSDYNMEYWWAGISHRIGLGNVVQSDNRIFEARMRPAMDLLLTPDGTEIDNMEELAVAQSRMQLQYLNHVSEQFNTADKASNIFFNTPVNATVQALKKQKELLVKNKAPLSEIRMVNKEINILENSLDKFGKVTSAWSMGLTIGQFGTWSYEKFKQFFGAVDVQNDREVEIRQLMDYVHKNYNKGDEYMNAILITGDKALVMYEDSFKDKIVEYSKQFTSEALSSVGETLTYTNIGKLAFGKYIVPKMIWDYSKLIPYFGNAVKASDKISIAVSTNWIKEYALQYYKECFKAAVENPTAERIDKLRTAGLLLLHCSAQIRNLFIEGFNMIKDPELVTDRLEERNRETYKLIAKWVYAYTSEDVLEQSDDDGIHVIIDGKVQRYSQMPVMQNKSILVPMRSIFESLGAKVEWDAKTDTAAASKGGTRVKISIGAGFATVNDKEIKLNAAARIVNGNTMVPVRFVSEALGSDVFWNSGSKTVIIKRNFIKELSAASRDVYGNRPGNNANISMVAEKGDWIYYSNSSDGYKLYKVKTDGTGKVKISDDACGSINVLEDWIYYQNNSEKRIYKIKTDGSSRIKISDDHGMYLNVVGDWIYYVNFMDDQKLLYKIKTDGTGRTKLDDGKCHNVNVYNGWIYYSKETKKSDGSNLYETYKMKTDGSNKSKLGNGLHCVVDGEWIFFSNTDDGSRIYKMRVDGSSKTKISDDASVFLNQKDGWVYYSNKDDGMRLYKIKVDGSGRKRLGYHTLFINMVDEWVYFYGQINNKYGYFKLRTDDTGWTAIN
ncbi:MAG: DUF5050 domain-containing protein [Clostridia bacterium]|nr:DUF5050 domain-containing protein [Clostridia bacterium]